MNLVGKIFVFLIFVMSLVFMTEAVFVFVTHNNWRWQVLATDKDLEKNPDLLRLAERQEFAKWKEELERTQQQLEKERAELRKTRLIVEADRAARRQEKSTLYAKSEVAQEAERKAEQRFQGLHESHEKNLVLIETQQQNMTRLGAEVDKVRLELKVARGVSDKHFAELVKLGDDVHSAQQNLVRQQRLNKALNVELAVALETLRKNGLKPGDTDVTPVIDGYLTEVDMTRYLVQVTVGSDDGIKQGHLMEVYRGKKYMGRIEILRVKPDQSAAMIIKSHLQGPMRRGDKAETRVGLNKVADLK